MPFAALLLACALALLSPRLQASLRSAVRASPALIFAFPAGVTAVFAAAAAWYGAFRGPLMALVAGYSLAPTICVWIAGSGDAGWLDLAAILLLWLPLELSAGASLVPRSAHGALHAVAYACGIVLALALFLIFRSFEGMKYRAPGWVDVRNAAIGLAISAAALIPLGLWIGYMSAHHAAGRSAAAVLLRLVLILFGTALPEEILFRALIQNWLAQRLGASNPAIVLAAIIFGCAHLNNGPQPAPNWRYAIVAWIAGLIFGKVFEKSRSIFASALVHMGVDGVKWAWF
ncbi:MAG TPA: CPBP family intramembrane glutamic endopeptidase [Bryobacteraceae bacterium]|nr:CPBP family intramembrane glutamic endopeptidase [Bryobacteraceae bacterium]